MSNVHSIYFPVRQTKMSANVILYNFWKEEYLQGEGIAKGYIDK